ncbi:MAG TPA: peptide ABC transporter substrate-binding protein [Anaerolineaceae bacterium]|jgi:peptide/nickel transport system substrate-binding protein|nr:peptide ABC transporter substrate-binding protein [Anaerolineaceae bacterium]HPD63526.1 peptide ABC transporter substrate-binding protein [Anaerolineaceae bacterium]HQF69539.1 peptide ABC transporter substrate-binding protein [Anaerolineaceae bacterium]HUM63580.1 peptide ABC transporter substrate-binding protein [Anaerolineaceae bacterium]
MKKYRWQLLVLFLTGLVVGTLLLLEKRGGLGEVNTPQPAQGGVYTEALIGYPQRMNPLLDSTNSVDRDVDKLIFSGLVKFDSRGIPAPDLAETIGISQDGILYNISLKPGLVWHDGEKLTTKDVLFTIELLRTGGVYIPEDIRKLWDSIEVYLFDDQHMQLKLPEAYAPFMDYLTFGVLPQHLFAGMDINEIAASAINLQPVGSGPYRFGELLMEGSTVSGIRLLANEDYAGGRPYLQEIVFRYYPDASSAYQAYVQGAVQGISEVPTGLLPQALANEDLRIYTGRLPRISLVLLNLNDPGVPFFKEIEVRKALMLGLNRQAIISQMFNGQAIVANSVILPGTWAYNESIAEIGYDPQLAAETLKNAGYVIAGENNTTRAKEEVPLSFVLSYPDDDLHLGIAQLIANNWQALGVNVTLEGVPPDVFVAEKLEPRSYQAALVDLNLSRTPDPDPYPFWDLGQAENGQNYSQWNNRLASDTIEQARVTTDLGERTRLYHNFQAIFAEELPALPLYYPVYNYAVSEQILGVTMGPLFDTSDRLGTITTWYLTTSRNQKTTDTAETDTGN